MSPKFLVMPLGCTARLGHFGLFGKRHQPYLREFVSHYLLCGQYWDEWALRDCAARHFGSLHIFVRSSGLPFFHLAKRLKFAGAEFRHAW